MAALSYSQSKPAKRNRRIIKTTCENICRTQETNSTHKTTATEQDFPCNFKKHLFSDVEIIQQEHCKGLDEWLMREVKVQPEMYVSTFKPELVNTVDDKTQ